MRAGNTRVNQLTETKPFQNVATSHHHLLFLLQNRTFSAGRGFNVESTVAKLQLQNEKHPLRRNVTSILDKETIDSLHLDSLPCQNCGTQRIDENQRFCHNCRQNLCRLRMDRRIFRLCRSPDPFARFRMLKAIDKHTKIIFIRNPNNPTGTYRNREQLINLHPRPHQPRKSPTLAVTQKIRPEIPVRRGLFRHDSLTDERYPGLSQTYGKRSHVPQHDRFPLSQLDSRQHRLDQSDDSLCPSPNGTY